MVRPLLSGSDETVVWFHWGIDTTYGNIADKTIVLGNSGSTNIITVFLERPARKYLSLPD